MKRQLTFGDYRIIDLCLFAVMLSASEFIITSAASKWFPGQPFTVSVTAAITTIVFIRWGAWGAVHALLGGLVFCYASGATMQQYLIYGIGNLFSLIILLPVRKIGSEKIRTDQLFSMLTAELTLLFMQTGRSLVALALGYEMGRCVGFFTTDSLSGLFAMVIIYIVRNLDGIFEDQKMYLIRLQKENASLNRQNETVKGGLG